MMAIDDDTVFDLLTRVVLPVIAGGFFAVAMRPKEAVSELVKPVNDEYFSELEEIKRRMTGLESKTDQIEKEIKGATPQENSLLESYSYIDDAIHYLEMAKEKNPCGKCKSSIEESLEFVKERTEYILKYGKRYMAMKKLQSEGIIRDLPWNELTEEEKNLVREESKTIQVEDMYLEAV
jgi:hypothetical protein